MDEPKKQQFWSILECETCYGNKMFHMWGWVWGAPISPLKLASPGWWFFTGPCSGICGMTLKVCRRGWWRQNKRVESWMLSVPILNMWSMEGDWEYSYHLGMAFLEVNPGIIIGSLQAYVHRYFFSWQWLLETWKKFFTRTSIFLGIWEPKRPVARERAQLPSKAGFISIENVGFFNHSWFLKRGGVGCVINSNKAHAAQLNEILFQVLVQWHKQGGKGKSSSRYLDIICTKPK